MLLSLLVNLAIIFLIVHFVKKHNAAQETRAQELATPLDMSDPTFKQLIDETVGVVNDMLEVSYDAHLFASEHHSGVISVLPHYRSSTGKNSTYGIQITMLDIGDLREGIRKYPKMYANLAANGRAEKLDRFLNTYSRCFNPCSNDYQYHSKATIVLSSKPEREIDLINSILKDQILKRCSLAEPMAGVGGFYTKSIPH